MVEQIDAPSRIPTKGLEKSSLLSSIKFFLSQLGRKAKKIYTDRDFKLIGEVVVELLETNDNPTSTKSTSHVTGAHTNIHKIKMVLQKFSGNIYSTYQEIG